MQTSLKAMMLGRREVVKEPERRGPGRPRKVKEEPIEDGLVHLEAPESIDHQMYEAAAPDCPRKMRKLNSGLSSHVQDAETPVPGAKMPGSRELRRNEGPHVRLQL